MDLTFLPMNKICSIWVRLPQEQRTKIHDLQRKKDENRWDTLTTIFFLILKDYLFCSILHFSGGSDGNESACNAGDLGLIPGSGRFPGEGNGYPLQYSCLENSMDRSLAGCSPWSCKEFNTTEWLTLSLHIFILWKWPFYNIIINTIHTLFSHHSRMAY